MDPEIVISVRNLTKQYKLYNRPIDRLKESLSPFRKKYHRVFTALDNISFDIKKGETVGIIGQNGSGKSTLLKVLTGVLTPTSGSVSVKGKISALLELGAGFNPEFTGMENIYFNGAIMGYTKAEINQRVDDILKFADIGDFINQPVKVYSSGMFMRLAFSVAINVDPDILIIDEALSVGDIRFQIKCLDKINEIKRRGAAILLVTHSNPGITDWSLLLNKGKEIYRGPSKETWNYYHRFLTDTNLNDNKKTIKSENFPKDKSSEPIISEGQTGQEIETYSYPKNNTFKNIFLFKESDTFKERVQKIRFGTGEVQFVNTELLNEQGDVVSSFNQGEILIYRVHLKVNTATPFLALGIQVRDRNGLYILGQETWQRRIPLINLNSNDKIVCEFRINCLMCEGEYTVTPGCAQKNMSMAGEIEYFDCIENCDVFSIVMPQISYFALYYPEIPVQVSIKRETKVDQQLIEERKNYYESFSAF